jgi:hypothetical protein
MSTLNRKRANSNMFPGGMFDFIGEFGEKANSNMWRDQQINGFLDSEPGAVLAQEQVMLDFVGKFPNVSWRWKAEKGSFYDMCCRKFNIDNDVNYDGIITFGSILGALSTRIMVAKITNLVSNVKVAYVGFNRYNIDKHDMDLPLPDSLAESCDAIMKHCDTRFKRLHTFDKIDGDHFVGAHPMDCYGLCK